MESRKPGFDPAVTPPSDEPGTYAEGDSVPESKSVLRPDDSNLPASEENSKAELKSSVKAQLPKIERLRTSVGSGISTLPETTVRTASTHRLTETKSTDQVLGHNDNYGQLPNENHKNTEDSAMAGDSRVLDDEFDFSPPTSLASLEKKVSANANASTDEESNIQSPFGELKASLQRMNDRNEKPLSTPSSGTSTSDSRDPRDPPGDWQYRQRVYIGAIASLIVLLIPCFVMMIYLFAVRNHLLIQLQELGIQSNLPLGFSALKTLHPVISYNQQDPELLSIFAEPVTLTFRGLSYRPACNSSQLEMARQLAAMSRYTNSILLERAGCETTREEVLSVIESLNIDMRVTIVSDLSKGEEETAKWIYDTLQLVRAFPKSIEAVLLKPLDHLHCSEIESYVIYLKRQLVVRRQGVDISVYPSFDVWSRDLLSLVEVIGINYNPEELGSKPNEVSHWIEHDITTICNDLPLKELLITGIGWLPGSSENSGDQSLEFATSWVCRDAPKLSSRARWFFESGLDGSVECLEHGLLDKNYQLRRPIDCSV